MMFEFQVVEKLDEVPEKYRGLYHELTEGEDAGKFAVNPQFSGIVADYTGTNKALTEARKNNKAANDESAKRRLALKAFEDIMDTLGIEEDSRTADGLKAYIDDIAEKAENGKELKINLDKVRDEMSKKHSQEIAKKDEEIASRDKSLEKYLVSERATRALTGAKGSVDLLLPHVKQFCKVVRTEEGDYGVRVVDESGEVRYNGSAQPMTVEDLVTEMKTNASFARGFESEDKGGSGTTPGSTSRNPAVSKTSDSSNMSSTDRIAAGLAKRSK
jgi:hypothetical protein